MISLRMQSQIGIPTWQMQQHVQQQSTPRVQAALMVISLIDKHDPGHAWNGSQWTDDDLLARTVQSLG
jgi:hypothetical protein